MQEEIVIEVVEVVAEAAPTATEAAARVFAANRGNIVTGVAAAAAIGISMFAWKKLTSAKK